MKMADPYDKFVYPDFTFNANMEQTIEELLRLFPEEEAAIRQYFVDLRLSTSGCRVNLWSGFCQGDLANLAKEANLLVGKDLALQTTGQYLDAHFKDLKIKGLLASQWGDYGLPPRESAFAMHAVLVRHYLKGAYFPEGGAAVIAESIIPIIEEKGGQVLINHPAERILIENGKVSPTHGRVALGGRRAPAPARLPLGWEQRVDVRRRCR